MIFYDRTQIRKRYVRTGICVIFVTFCALVGILVWSIYTGPVQLLAEIANEPRDMYIALTFDDGPHPEHTRAILKMLQKKEIPATFFFVGHAMLQHPDVVTEVAAAGYGIGNHTFTHSENVHRSKERMRFELEISNQIIERLTGQRTRFYRSPYLLDFDQSTSEFITSDKQYPDNHPLTWMTELGYIGVSAYIDPRDWEVKDGPTLFTHVIERTQHGNILLLHDGGEQRQATLEALPYIIDELQARGFVFVSLSELSGIDAQALSYPTHARALSHNLNVSILGTIYTHFVRFVLMIIFFILVISIARLLAITFARLCSSPKKPTAYNGGVSVLIPAYNEERNLAATIASVTDSTHENLEIFVIDDGSTDKTREVALAAVANATVLVTYVYKKNGGKASALNLGITLASNDVVIAIDGDTIIHPDAISHLAGHFNDPLVGAVAGRVSAITNGAWLTWFQDIEYTVSQHIEKRAFNTVLGSINVIPGAIGGWRRSVIEEIGGYSDDTQVEDQDLTLAVHKHGYQLRYDHCAVAYTEVPSSISAFIKQRFRWMFGTLQCLWKYKHSFFNPQSLQLGYIILPYGVLFSLITPLLMPVTDGLLVYALWTGNWQTPMIAAALFTAIDLIYHGFGLMKEPKKLAYLPLIPFQRIFYRLVFSYIMLKSTVYAIEGTRAYWAAQLRTGSAQTLFQQQHEVVQASVIQPDHKILA